MTITDAKKINKKLFDIALQMAELDEHVLDDDMWQGKIALSARDHSLVALTNAVSVGRLGEIPHHMKQALLNGLTREEIVATITQLAFYSGWPNSFAALRIAKQVFEEIDTFGTPQST